MNDGESLLADVQARDIRDNLISALPFSSALAVKSVDRTRQISLPDDVQLAPPASFYSLAPYLRAADSPRDRRDLSKPYDLLALKCLDADRGRGLRKYTAFTKFWMNQPIIGVSEPQQIRCVQPAIKFKFGRTHRLS